MKRILGIVSAFALSTGVAYAMEEEAMDEEMMMEAPSVSLGGSAELGFKNVDDDSEDESMHLIRKYQVDFSSQGTTDGGLAFGAGISIEDEHEGDTKQVNGSNVWVGAADGTWKLKLGGNDPGIDVVGAIADSDSHFDGGDNAAIGLEGAFGATSYRITIADPQATGKEDGDWSAGASHSIGDVTVGFGMDSESGLAIGVGTELSGVGLKLYYSTSDDSEHSLKAARTKINNFYMSQEMVTAIPDGEELNDAETPSAYNTRTGRILPNAATYTIADKNLGAIENTGLGISASIPAGEGASLSVGYSTVEGEQKTPAKGWYSEDGSAPATAGNTNVNGSVATETKIIDIEFSYDLGGGAKFVAGIEKKDTETTNTLTSSVEDSPFPDVTVTDGDDTERETISGTDSSDVTTLTAKLAFTF